MQFTLGYVRDDMQKHVNFGTCNREKIDNTINRSVQMLINFADWKLTQRRVRILATNRIVALPREINKILAFNINHMQGNALSQYYEFLEGGPGRIDEYAYTGGRDLQDLGSYHPTFRDMPSHSEDFTPLKIFAMSTEPDDASLSLTVRGRDQYNSEIVQAGVFGDTVPINRWTDGVEGGITNFHTLSLSTKEFRSIISVIKPRTKGYVTLYAYNPDYTEGATGDPMLYYLCKYHPDETNPGYRWYKVVGKCDDDCWDGIIALVKLAYIPAVQDNDVLLIQNLLALQFAAKALAQYDAYNISDGNELRKQAIQFLHEASSNKQQETNEIDVQCNAWGFSDVKGLIA